MNELWESRIAAQRRAGIGILSDFALGLSLGTAVFTPCEMSSLRIDQRAQKPFLNSIQARPTLGENTADETGKRCGNYRHADVLREKRTRPEEI